MAGDLGTVTSSEPVSLERGKGAQIYLPVILKANKVGGAKPTAEKGDSFFAKRCQLGPWGRSAGFWGSQGINTEVTRIQSTWLARPRAIDGIEWSLGGPHVCAAAGWRAAACRAVPGSTGCPRCGGVRGRSQTGQGSNTQLSPHFQHALRAKRFPSSPGAPV